MPIAEVAGHAAHSVQDRVRRQSQRIRARGPELAVPFERRDGVQRRLPSGGLLPANQRTRAGYRRYHSSAIDRVRLIQRALLIGFSLKELSGVLRQRDHGAPPCHRMRNLVGERLAALETRLVELADLRDEIRGLLTEWDKWLAQTPDGQRARLLDVLATGPAPPYPRVLTLPRRKT
jgi:DNA-binding transcriptional MerR regulator